MVNDRHMITEWTKRYLYNLICKNKNEFVTKWMSCYNENANEILEKKNKKKC